MTHDFVPGGDEGKAMGPGGHWFQPGKMVHDNHCEEKGGTCLSFVYLPKGFDMIPAKVDAKPAPPRQPRAEEAVAEGEAAAAAPAAAAPLRLRPRRRLRRSSTRLDLTQPPRGLTSSAPAIFISVRQPGVTGRRPAGPPARPTGIRSTPSAECTQTQPAYGG